MSKVYGLIPAAGSGSRIGGALPKQYLEMAGKPLLLHAIERLCALKEIEQVLVVLAPGDVHFARYSWNTVGARMMPLYCGGQTRAASVFNGLSAARDLINEDDWVMVHDAVRPCLPQQALQRLLDTVRDDEVGGLLALPVVDTLKRDDGDQRVLTTEPREQLWQAQTPQMFRYRLLIEALRASADSMATDEASAVERMGHKPLLVTGDARNFKITYPHDLALAEALLQNLHGQKI